MGAFDGLIRGGVPSKCEEYTYIAHQPAFRLTKDFTLSDLIKRFKHAESICSDRVYVPSPDKGFSDVCLDIWYAEALINHLKSKEVLHG